MHTLSAISGIILLLLVFISGCGSQRATTTGDPARILWAADWSPDGSRIAVGGNHEVIRLISGKDGKVVREIPFKNTVTKLRWHPSEPLLAIASQTSEDNCTILNTATGVRIPLDGISEYGARGIGWNSTGDMLAVGDNNGVLHFFSKTGERLRSIDAGQKAITGLSWHPARPVVVTVGAKIAIYDYGQDSLSSIRPREEDVLMLCVDWHPSGEMFVTGDYGDYEFNYPALLQFWDAAGNKILEIEKSKAEYRNIQWNQSGEVLATASDALRLWSAEGKLIDKGNSQELLWGLAWGPRDQKIVTTGEQGQVLIWNSEPRVVKEVDY